MARNYWLTKQEPDSYSYDTLVEEQTTAWTGVRNFQARNHLRAMKKGDLVLFYHSGDAKEVVGIARIVREAYPDPTATEGDWVAVDMAAVKPVKKPVALADIKQDAVLREMPLVRQSRLSVSPVAADQFRRLLELAETREP